MSEKKLLNESTIRRFMKLANVEPLTNGFIQEMSHAYVRDVNEALDEADDEFEVELNEEEEEELDMGEEDPDMGEEDPDMDEEEPDMGDEEPDMDMEGEGEPGAADISLTEEEAQLLIDLGDRLRDAMDEEEGEGEGMDFGAEEEEEEDFGEEEPEEEEIVQEILKRVTQRLIREKMARK